MKRRDIGCTLWFATIVLLASACRPAAKERQEGEFLIGRWQVTAAIEFEENGRAVGLIDSSRPCGIVEYHRNGIIKNWSDEFSKAHDHWRFEPKDSILFITPFNATDPVRTTKVRRLRDESIEMLDVDENGRKKGKICLKRVGPVLDEYSNSGAPSRSIGKPDTLIMMDCLEPVPKGFTGTTICFWDFWGRDTSRISSYVDGVEAGPFRSRRENGELETRGSIKAKKFDGRYEQYYPNGQLLSAYEYREGRIWNVLALYDSLGHPLDFGTLKNGNGRLKSYEWYAGLTGEGPVVNGHKHGFWKHWTGREFGDSTEYRDGVNQETGLFESY